MNMLQCTNINVALGGVRGRFVPRVQRRSLFRDVSGSPRKSNHVVRLGHTGIAVEKTVATGVYHAP